MITIVTGDVPDFTLGLLIALQAHFVLVTGGLGEKVEICCVADYSRQ
jgi:hypothetical protein